MHKVDNVYSARLKKRLHSSVYSKYLEVLGREEIQTRKDSVGNKWQGGVLQGDIQVCDLNRRNFWDVIWRTMSRKSKDLLQTLVAITSLQNLDLIWDHGSV